MTKLREWLRYPENAMLIVCEAAVLATIVFVTVMLAP